MLVGAGFLLPSTVFPDVPPPSSSHRPETFTFHCYGDYPNIYAPQNQQLTPARMTKPKRRLIFQPHVFQVRTVNFQGGYAPKN